MSRVGGFHDGGKLCSEECQDRDSEVRVTSSEEINVVSKSFASRQDGLIDTEHFLRDLRIPNNHLTEFFNLRNEISRRGSQNEGRTCFGS
jgi:hypothetical protein